MLVEGLPAGTYTDLKPDPFYQYEPKFDLGSCSIHKSKLKIGSKLDFLIVETL